MIDRDDISPEDVLSPAELRAYYRQKNANRNRCHDRMCGALDCPNCHPEGMADDEEEAA